MPGVAVHSRQRKSVFFIVLIAITEYRMFPFPVICCLGRRIESCEAALDSDRLVGLVVKASASRAGGPGFESR